MQILKEEIREKIREAATAEFLKNGYQLLSLSSLLLLFNFKAFGFVSNFAALVSGAPNK